MRERSLYPAVREFLKSNFHCIYVHEKPAVTHYGAVDVVGLRQSEGKYGGTAEVIAVEVKATHSRFLNSAGQALGYSVMADRCYLAVGDDAFDEVERELASVLNIGLIAIRSGRRCEILLTSPQRRPLRAQRLALIHHVGFVECVVCGTLHPRSEMLKQRGANVHTALSKGQGLRYVLSEKQGPKDPRRYICRHCVKALSGPPPARAKD